jgi:hypothetical protein
MKKAFIVLFLSLMSFLPGQGFEFQGTINPGSEIGEDVIKVYYFHFTRRCATCQAVEDETRSALENLYPDQIKSGRIIFESLNLEEPSGETQAAKLQVAGQALLVVKGDKKIDLTDEGFLYARANPEKLRDKIQSVIDPLL